MSTTETSFLGLLFSGTLALLAGMLLTRLQWRPDIPPYSWQTRFLDVTLHPHRYVKDAPLRAIRSLTVVGALLLACAAGLVAYEVVRVTSHGYGGAKAVADFDRAIALKPDFRYAYINRANARLLRHPGLALDDFHRVGMYPERQVGMLGGAVLAVVAGIVLVRRVRVRRGRDSV